MQKFLISNNKTAKPYVIKPSLFAACVEASGGSLSAAGLLYQIFVHSKKGTLKDKKGEAGWLALTRAQWMTLTGLTRHQYDGAVKVLKLNGLVDHQRRKLRYSELIRHKKNSIGTIEELLVCYRCFKECRNSFMHNGGVALPEAYDAYQAYSVLTARTLGVTEKPDCPPITVGQPIKLSLRGVVGFSEVILRLITTLDAEFSCSLKAEEELRGQWLEALGRKQRFLKGADRSRRERQIEGLLKTLHLPKPIKMAQLESYLKSHRFIV